MFVEEGCDVYDEIIVNVGNSIVMMFFLRVILVLFEDEVMVDVEEEDEFIVLYYLKCKRMLMF